MEQNPSLETNRSSDIQESLPFNGNLRFITTFTTARHLYLSRARSVQ